MADSILQPLIAMRYAQSAAEVAPERMSKRLMKRCPHCRREKPISQFYVVTGKGQGRYRADSLEYMCSSCSKKLRRLRYQRKLLAEREAANREYINAQHEDHTQR